MHHFEYVLFDWSSVLAIYLAFACSRTSNLPVQNDLDNFPSSCLSDVSIGHHEVCVRSSRIRHYFLSKIFWMKLLQDHNRSFLTYEESQHLAVELRQISVICWI